MFRLGHLAADLRRDPDAGGLGDRQQARALAVELGRQLAASRQSEAALREELADKREELSSLTARWEAEKQGLNRLGDLRVRLDEARYERERCARVLFGIAVAAVGVLCYLQWFVAGFAVVVPVGAGCRDYFWATNSWPSVRYTLPYLSTVELVRRSHS